MKVLVVEDDRALGLFLQKGLKLDGHETAWVEDGESALEHVGAYQPDLMVLDLSLPRLDGISVLEQIKHHSSRTAVLVLTGRNDVDERVRCLNLGADDFLQKPFSFHELAARCRAILRRGNASASTVLQSGDLLVDLLHRTVVYCGQAVDLTPKEFALLACLMRTKGTCCSREALLRDVWQIRTDASTNVVDVYINYLRKKLASTGMTTGNGPSLIETVRGAGYRLTTQEFRVQHATSSPNCTLLARGA